MIYEKIFFIKNSPLFLIIFILIGCSTDGYYPQASSNKFKSTDRNEQIEQELNQINHVYGLVINNYVDPVPPYKLLFEAVKGIESKVGNTHLLLKETDVVMSPIAQIPYDTRISVEETRNAIFEIYRFVVSNYPNYSPIEISKSLLKGMLQSLDSHSCLLSPDDFEALIHPKGEFTGIGVSITMRNGFVTVISPIEGTLAYKAGIKSGDKIVKINSKAIIDLQQAVRLLRGPKGTEVVVTIAREKAKKPIDFKLIRDVIPVESVKATILKPGYGYIRITNFRDNTIDDLVAELEKLESAQISLKGLILDLRDNPGGLLNQAIEVSDLFIEKGTILYIKGRLGKNTKIFKATPNKVKRNYPIVLLINGGSASASEIVAGALQDQKRALILGTTSFGKGSVQSVEKLSDGYGLKLTIAKYYTPNGRAIQTEGIVPDILLEHSTIDDKDAKTTSKVIRLFSDNQIKQAYRILKRTHSNRTSEMPNVWEEDINE